MLRILLKQTLIISQLFVLKYDNINEKGAIIFYLNAKNCLYSKNV